MLSPSSGHTTGLLPPGAPTPNGCYSVTAEGRERRDFSFGLKSLVGNSVIKSNIIKKKKKDFQVKRKRNTLERRPLREYFTLFPLLLSDACKCSLQGMGAVFWACWSWGGQEWVDEQPIPLSDSQSRENPSSGPPWEHPPTLSARPGPSSCSPLPQTLVLGRMLLWGPLV